MWTTIQNVVFPLDRDPDVLPLYADPETWTSIGSETFKVSAHAHVENILSRSSLRVTSGRRISFASYFNAFPASYWQHWTNLKRIRLELSTTGNGTILVYRSNSQGAQQRVESRRVEGTATSEFVLPLKSFGDGGWYWFELEADVDGLVLKQGKWTTDAKQKREGKVSLGTTTLNKPDYCVATLGAIAESPEVVDAIDRIFIIDQGTQKVADEDGFTDVADALGDKLEVISQSNLGGSGGFARSMAETLKRPESDFLVLLDDDVKIEPESILRALAFARHSKRSAIVGGHMFDLLNRPVLHAFAEIVDEKPFIWRPQYREQFPHDFRVTNLRQTRWMHTRMDADYNGWWFCLIPKDVIETIGLSLPAFIKWDDAEYSLRARANGYPTVSLPGVALWHVSWLDKDDSIDWQAYFHARNRVVTALLHSRFRNGGLLVRDSWRLDLKHLLSMQYYAVTLRHMALRDVLRGPEHMHRTLPTQLGVLRDAARSFREMNVLRTDEEIPPTNRGKQVFPVASPFEGGGGPHGARLAVFTAKMTVRHWLTKPSSANVSRPEVELAKRDATWFRTPYYDSALVSTADGSGKSWYQRDRATFRYLLRESIVLHRRLRRDWPALAAQYRQEMPELTRPDVWQDTFTK
ncbi:galactofuranosylgalactofuranosylrhamnosyl-N-acetylglucosaminyl-diphospho-decaprenol beta-1,5/1,6-galactofuranosyltransferase [Paramicrobacterium humi]|uniref:Galactofuranosylgalactofuranosylrhamnosyl-N-acetylglucosaminyl-diphospho-decaprenol beta-1,5/1,6-galactofuranosyltransferase n=1 Tax=Paramicrobacterium humi TaxID=640635 RepID=A0A1H4IRI4_9MICO|nr:glycosyltransferase [Microbacterium humi]SEB36669.1 galactofuranosylgalactofuranosylrhamnosyl-N-acetylglucosaminyl-diphospho-decaprenol beta-1,5/1,6-galactofuranosyltransferase [Microbacterium humi]